MNQEQPLFTTAELKRVGTAATMVAICGTIIIVAMTMMLGHYNSLAHSGPKAVLDGAVIALLIGQKGRWRCLALLGIVYGLVLLLQVGVFYLLPVMTMAGVLAAGAGRFVSLFNRTAAVLVAAVLYESLAGCGAPIKIYFATSGRTEPFLWGLWLAEFPFRIIGALCGVWLAHKLRRASDVPTENVIVDQHIVRSPITLPRPRGIGHAAARIIACAIACTVPMFVESAVVLGIIASLYILLALVAGLRWRIVQALLGLLWGWMIFGALSYAWNHDMARVWDMLRTLVLRFTPITLASLVLITTIRPVDVVRLLRKLRVSPIIIIPFSAVIRSVPASRRALRQVIAMLRAKGKWNGPLSMLRHPISSSRALFGSQVRQWTDDLAKE